MLRLLADENLNAAIVRGMLLRKPHLDIVQINDAGLCGADDPQVLAWADEQCRILLTYDRATMPDHALHRLATAQPMPGVFILHDRLPVGEAITELLLIIACSKMEDWDGRIVYLPL